MIDDDFFDSADAFIKLANELNNKRPTSRVSAIMMYANARYNAHNFYATDGKEENKQKAIDYYCEQYRRMLLDNMDEMKDKEAKQPDKLL